MPQDRENLYIDFWIEFQRNMKHFHLPKGP